MVSESVAGVPEQRRAEQQAQRAEAAEARVPALELWVARLLLPELLSWVGSAEQGGSLELVLAAQPRQPGSMEELEAEPRPRGVAESAAART